jgi:dTDP-4-amino-4,6-dideoxygalactose transaminase
MTTATRRVPYAYLPTELARGRPLRTDIEKRWADLVDRGDFTLGRAVENFETAWAKAVGAPHAIGLRSGTDALALAIIGLGLGHVTHAPRCDCERKRIAVPVNTFYASVGAILQAGAWPVLVDVDDEYLIDQRQVTKLLKAGAIDAVMPVAWTGNPVDVPAGAWEDLPIIHDAAQAVGAEIGGRPIGALGQAVCYSLHPLKNIHAAGDGGMVTSRDDRFMVTLARLRNHGLISRDDWLMPGYNARLEPIQAAAAHAHLAELGWITDRRNQNSAMYDRLLSDLPQITIPPRPADKRQAFHTYVVQADSRDNLVHVLAERGIEAKVHYPKVLAAQPALAMLGHQPGDFPVAEAQADRIVSLPIHQFLTEEDIRHVSDAIHEFYR